MLESRRLGARVPYCCEQVSPSLSLATRPGLPSYTGSVASPGAEGARLLVLARAVLSGCPPRPSLDGILLLRRAQGWANALGGKRKDAAEN